MQKKSSFYRRKYNAVKEHISTRIFELWFSWISQTYFDIQIQHTFGHWFWLLRIQNNTSSYKHYLEWVGSHDRARVRVIIAKEWGNGFIWCNGNRVNRRGVEEGVKILSRQIFAWWCVMIVLVGNVGRVLVKWSEMRVTRVGPWLGSFARSLYCFEHFLFFQCITSHHDFLHLHFDFYFFHSYKT